MICTDTDEPIQPAGKTTMNTTIDTLAELIRIRAAALSEADAHINYSRDGRPDSEAKLEARRASHLEAIASALSKAITHINAYKATQ